MSQDRPIKFLCWQLIKSAAAPSGAAKKREKPLLSFLILVNYHFAFGWYLHCGHHSLLLLPTELLPLALQRSLNGPVISEWLKTSDSGLMKNWSCCLERFQTRDRQTDWLTTAPTFLSSLHPFQETFNNLLKATDWLQWGGGGEGVNNQHRQIGNKGLNVLTSET